VRVATILRSTWISYSWIMVREGARGQLGEWFDTHSMNEATLAIEQPDMVLTLFGAKDQHLRTIRDRLGVEIVHRRGQIAIRGEAEPVALATETLERLKSLARRHGTLQREDVEKILAQVTGDAPAPSSTRIDVFDPVRKIQPRTRGQAHYVDTIRRHAITLAFGPAGTGKTYLAVALAVEAIKHERIRKIVLCRPAVEAGESLGFLPGDLQAKINPYLRPLLDALHDMIDYEQIKRMMEQDIIEVIPLAYMRGRTLNDAFIILDEAQNATIAQMKMFLTRMGENSKVVVSGDATQIDLPHQQKSGLIDALQRLKPIRGIGQVELTKGDIVRHSLVQEIVRAYEAPVKSAKAESPTRSRHS